MAKLPRAFKRKDHGSKGSTVPSAEYIAKIVQSAYKPNSKKTGHGAQLFFEIQNKKYKGRKLSVWLNLDHPNEAAVEMANDELGSICDAVGKGMVKDTTELHGKLMIIKVREVPADGATPPQNVIDMYAPIDGEEEEEEELEEEEDEEEDDDDDDDNESEVTAETVTALARKYKTENSLKALKEMLEEYDITKITEIKDLDEDDLESLSEDLEEALEE